MPSSAPALFKHFGRLEEGSEILFIFRTITVPPESCSTPGIPSLIYAIKPICAKKSYCKIRQILFLFFHQRGHIRKSG
ncbi:hypothetical protein CW304_22780 [Bacillus sp. UFRGS-B20]|nr:hypothetical protein CW304_22780 [Bacillus sp. UFRGS-B20]